MVTYHLIERPNRDLVVGDTFSALGSTDEGDEVRMNGTLRSYGASVTLDLPKFAVGGYVTDKKEEKMTYDEVIFEDLKEVFELDYEDAGEFFRDVHYAAEGIRQHDALHRVEDAFGGVVEFSQPIDWDINLPNIKFAGEDNNEGDKE